MLFKCGVHLWTSMWTTRETLAFASKRLLVGSPETSLLPPEYQSFGWSNRLTATNPGLTWRSLRTWNAKICLDESNDRKKLLSSSGFLFRVSQDISGRWGIEMAKQILNNHQQVLRLFDPDRHNLPLEVLCTDWISPKSSDIRSKIRSSANLTLDIGFASICWILSTPQVHWSIVRIGIGSHWMG